MYSSWSNMSLRLSGLLRTSYKTASRLQVSLTVLGTGIVVVGYGVAVNTLSQPARCLSTQGKIALQNHDKQEHVVVMGAGVVGVTTAYFLVKQGYKVTVVDTNEQAANATSFGNAGGLRLSESTPLANPGTPLKALKNIVDGFNPFNNNLQYFVFSPFDILKKPELIGWGLKFLYHCFAGDHQAKSDYLRSFNVFSVNALIDVLQEEGIAEDCDFSECGSMKVYRSAEHVPTQARKSDTFTEQLLTRKEILELEPGLSKGEVVMVGVTFVPEDKTADCQKFTTSLANILQSKYHVKFLFGASILGATVDDGRVVGLKTSAGLLEGDHYVTCLGNGSTKFLGGLSVNCPVYPITGYSITLPSPTTNVMNRDYGPKRLVTDEESELYFTRLGDRVRFATIAKFTADYDEKISQQIIDEAQRLYPHAGDWHNAYVWVGSRPQSCDGMPLVGTSKYSNLHVNTGHGTRGWLQSCGSAKLLVEIISGQKLSMPVTLLDPNRF
eukprot:GFYU01022678.1.p1 GENE.GFYU01022678.1~~GFYU01022678.1.p1  ORF type:complete len:497 (-),score=79.35 GFYU01022678.1:1085-2575(-)